MSEYDRILKQMSTDCIARSVIENNYGKSIEEIYYLIEMEYMKNTSFYVLPDSRILLYPSIRERHANKQYYSTFEEAPIYKGSVYINYNALFIDLDSKAKYVLKKPLIFELGADVPGDITELDSICREYEYDLPLKRVNKKRTS